MCDNCDLAKMKIEYEALLSAFDAIRDKYVRESREIAVRAATLRAQIMAAEGVRRIRLVK